MVRVSPGWPASAAWPARIASASRADGDDVGMPDCRRKAQNSAALTIVSAVRTRCSKPLLGSRRVIEASQASDGADAEEFSTHLVMGNIGDDDDRVCCQIVFSHVSQLTTCGLLGARTIIPGGPLSSTINRAMINRDLRIVSDGDDVRRACAWLLPTCPVGPHRAWPASDRRTRQWPGHSGPVPPQRWGERSLWHRCKARDGQTSHAEKSANAAKS